MAIKDVRKIISEMIIEECSCSDCSLYDSMNENSLCKSCGDKEKFKPKKYIIEHINDKTKEIIAAFNLR